MHPYIVTVADQKKQRLSIPCAELETAELVRKNLESLFPGSVVSIKSQPSSIESTTVSSPLSLVHSTKKVFHKDISSNNYDELEQELFDGVA